MDVAMVETPSCQCLHHSYAFKSMPGSVQVHTSEEGWRIGAIPNVHGVFNGWWPCFATLIVMFDPQKK
jgi:hypothetical protein